MGQEIAPATNIASLYVTEIKETHSEVNEIQNNRGNPAKKAVVKKKKKKKEGCSLQEINAPQDQLTRSAILASALFADLRLQRAPSTGDWSVS